MTPKGFVIVKYYKVKENYKNNDCFLEDFKKGSHKLIEILDTLNNFNLKFEGFGVIRRVFADFYSPSCSLELGRPNYFQEELDV